MKHITTLFIGTALWVAVGCTNINSQHGPSVTELRPSERGFVAGLGIESQDLVTISEKMARGILGAEPIANAEGKPVVVLEPINNDTRFPIDKDIFLARIRVALQLRQVVEQGRWQLALAGFDRLDLDFYLDGVRCACPGAFDRL